MRRWMYLVPVLILAVIFCAWPKTSAESGEEIVLTFVHAEKNVNTALSDGEAERIIRILDGNPYHLISSGAPSCGFNPDISLKVGSRIYAVACDACNTVLDCGSQRYFSVSKKNMEYLHSLFEKYGGYFPCI